MDAWGFPTRLRPTPTQNPTPHRTLQSPARLLPLRCVHPFPLPHFPAFYLLTCIGNSVCAGATDVPSFASPLEFVKHAEWLMRGARRTPDTRRSPRCSCKYCSQHAYVSREADAEGNAAAAGDGAGASPSVRSAHFKNLKNRADKRQSVISRGLRRVRARVLARIKNEEGDGDGGGGGDDANDANGDGDGGGEEDVDEVMEDVEERGGTGEEQGGGTGEGVGERPEVENGVGIDADVVDVNVNVNVETTNAVPTTDHGANGTD
jgi:Transcription-silencing protein, cryptic loci regulator Clr2